MAERAQSTPATDSRLSQNHILRRPPSVHCEAGLKPSCMRETITSEGSKSIVIDYQSMSSSRLRIRDRHWCRDAKAKVHKGSYRKDATRSAPNLIFLSVFQVTST